MLLANLLPRALLTKKPEDSGHEIGYSALVTNGNKLLFFFQVHTTECELGALACSLRSMAVLVGRAK